MEEASKLARKMSLLAFEVKLMLRDSLLIPLSFSLMNNCKRGAYLTSDGSLPVMDVFLMITSSNNDVLPLISLGMVPVIGLSIKVNARIVLIVVGRLPDIQLLPMRKVSILPISVGSDPHILVYTRLRL